MSEHKDKKQRKAKAQLDTWAAEAYRHFAALHIPSEEVTSDAILEHIEQTHGRKVVMQTIQKARGLSDEEVLEHCDRVFFTAMSLEAGVAEDRIAEGREIVEAAKYQLQHDPDFAQDVREFAGARPDEPGTEPPKGAQE